MNMVNSKNKLALAGISNAAIFENKPSVIKLMIDKI